MYDLKATVHDPNEHPAIEVNGFLVPPGRMALATISKTTVRFKEKNERKALIYTEYSDILSLQDFYLKQTKKVALIHTE